MSLLDCKVCDQGYVFVGPHAGGNGSGHKEYTWEDVHGHILKLFGDDNEKTLYKHKLQGEYDNYNNITINKHHEEGDDYNWIFTAQDQGVMLINLKGDGTYESASPNDPNVWITLKKNGHDTEGAGANPHSEFYY